MTALDIASAALLLAGGLFSMLGGIGVVRFPDVLTRLQAATKPQVFGLLLILLGTSLRLEPADAVGLGLVALFQVLTAPVLAQLFGGVAYRTGAYEERVFVSDELDERLRAKRR
ncbi:multicomponent Na+:H+ antiporter subunit G [Saccharomonospora amisosensis]|uniref:Multicomponent Na+:H+ antiporter subunit G n=1 Tax=Saccharomonospora amisosensis TaxID=1128677 RepID=A0A7X5ZQ93_9PSEU|nr:monovalent cation/H(+) antiporter subunit G [Saccharomonospora amisosensis]NIJ11573.1 multicomponent Na+:H+ antiporter subunit G [Saccharomonospora amisosensis]